MSTITNLQVKLYSTQEDEPVNPVNPDIPDTGGDEEIDGPGTGLFTVIDTTNGQDSNGIDIAPIAFSLFAILIILAFGIPKLIKKIHGKNAERYDLNSKKFRNFRFLSTILASSSLLVGLVTTAFGLAPNLDPLDVEAAEKVVIDAPILDTNNIAVVHSTIKLPASVNGSRLYISSKYTSLVDINNPKYQIPSITEKGKLTDNTYGIYIGKDKPSADSEFYPIYDLAKLYSIFETTSQNAETVDIWYGVRSKSNKEATYSVDLTVEATEGLRIMQEMTPEVCAELKVGVMDYKFLDIRDDKVYNVARYEDGNCWMVDTLDLDLSTGTTLTSANTNLPEGTTYTPNTNTTTNIEIWEYANPFSDEYKPKLMEYTRLRLNLRSAECNEDNERWCKEEGEEGYDEWMSTKNYISDLITGSYPYVWDKNYTPDSWFPLTEEDIVFLREKLLNFFGVEELTEKEKEWNNSFNDIINDSAQNVLIHKWDEFWQGDCNAITAGDEFADADSYKSWCREQVDRYKTLLYDEAFKSGEYKDFPHYSLDTTNQSDGNYYNLLSATAGTLETHYNTPSAENDYDSSAYFTTSGSICPANWHLATKTDFKHIMSANKVQVINEGDGMTVYDKKLSASSNFLTNNGFYLAVDDDEFFSSISDIFPAPGVHKEISIPDEYVEQIGLSHATLESLSNIGYYIEMDVAGGGSLAQSLSDYNSMIRNGLSVRCVADSEFSLSFDGNSDSDVSNLPGAKKEKKTEENEETGVTFTIPDTVPTRADGVEFMGWATSKTNAANFIASYQPGDEITVYGMVTLYAVWNIEAPYKTPKAIYTENRYLTFVYDKKRYAVGSTFRTDAGSSKITEVFHEDAFKYTPLTTAFGFDNMGNILNDTSTAEQYFPGWSTIHFGQDSDGDGKKEILGEEVARYDQIDFEASFKDYKPENTQFWFALNWTADYSNTTNINVSEVKNMLGMFMWDMNAEFKVNPETGKKEIDTEGTTTSMSLDFTGWDTSKVENMSTMFAGFLATNIYRELKGIEDLDVSNVTNMYGMFEYTRGLKNDQIEQPEPLKIDLSKWNTSKVENMAETFYGTGGLGSEADAISLMISGVSNWNTSSVTNMDSTFRGSYLAYDSLDLSAWDTSKVTNMHGMFANLHAEKPEGKTTTLNLSGWNTSNVTNMSGMFGDATNPDQLGRGSGSHVDELNLTSVIKPINGKFYKTGWDIRKVETMDRMFSRGDYTTIYANRDWSSTSASTTEIFKNSDNLVGGNGTTNKNGSYYKTIAYARPDGGPDSATPGLFTDPYATIEEYEPEDTYEYYGTSSGEPDTTTEPGTTEPSTGTTSPNSTEEPTGPLGVINRARVEYTDTALIIVIGTSIALVITGALAIYFIEKKNREDDEDEF